MNERLLGTKMVYEKAYLSTEDFDFSEDLQNANIEGVTVLTQLTAAVQFDQSIQHIIEYASDRAIDLFCLWLAVKVTKKKPKKTRINGRKIPLNQTKIARIIKHIENEIEASEDDPEDDEL